MHPGHTASGRVGLEDRRGDSQHPPLTVAAGPAACEGAGQHDVRMRRTAQTRYARRRRWPVLLAACITAAAAPAAAQVDISGMWTPLPRNQDGSGMTGDAAGIPISDEGRARAQSWSPEEFDVAEWVCRPHAWDYSLEGPLSQIRFWPVIDRATQQLVAYQGHINMEGQETTIWMDGREHPPRNALHTWSGFTTGEWDGNVLVTTTTHLKEAYIRRTGLMRGARATVRTRWRRIGEYLQATVIMHDPAYLTEPYVRSSLMWIADAARPMAPYPCEEATETVVPRGTVPHFLPGESPLPGWDPNQTDRFGTPYEARLGGAATMFPEYIDTIFEPDAPRTGSATADTGSVESWAPDLSAPAPGEVQVLPVQGNVYALFGAGGNITVQVGDDGILLVDAGLESMSEAVLEAIRRISSAPIRYIINTTAAAEHTGGNEAIAARGETIPWREETYSGGPQAVIGTDRASVVAYLNVLYRMSAPSGQIPPRAEGAWPDNTYSTPWKRLYFNNEPVIITHRPANTDGNSLVLFRKSDVVATGDLLNLTRFPAIDVEAGGSIQQILDGLNYLISIVVPSLSAGGGTLVVPGHGRIADHADVAYYRDMVSVVRDRIQHLIDEGLTVEEVIAARPTAGYDALYGTDTGPWTTDRFVAAAYESLTR